MVALFSPEQMAWLCMAVPGMDVQMASEPANSWTPAKHYTH